MPACWDLKGDEAFNWRLGVVQFSSFIQFHSGKFGRGFEILVKVVDHSKFQVFIFINPLLASY